MTRGSPARTPGQRVPWRTTTQIVAVTSRDDWARNCQAACSLLSHTLIEIAEPASGCQLPASAAVAGLVLLDDLPRTTGGDVLDTLELRQAASPPVILASGSCGLERLERATRLGVRGLVPPDAGAPTLSRAIDAVLHGELWMSRRTLSLLLGRLVASDVEHHVSGFLSNPSLTEREREVAHMTVQGLSNRETAEALNIGVQTVKIHLYHVYQKLHLHRRGELISRATGLARDQG